MRDSEEKNTILLLQDLIKEPVNESIAELAGNLRRKTKSHQLWLDDTLIAATAIQSNATLVTKNAKHYPFKNLKVIKIS
jgi:predicted nucleic acid-binding protein